MIPSERNYKKIVENKYAQRVLNELGAEPKYSASDTVQFRPGARKAGWQEAPPPMEDGECDRASLAAPAG